MSGLDQLERDEEFMEKLLTLLFKDSKKYPIIKVAACPGPLEDNEHFKTLEAKRVLFFDTNSPEESLKNMFPELQTGDAKKKEDERNDNPLQNQETGHERSQARSQEKDKGPESAQEKRKGKDQGKGIVRKQQTDQTTSQEAGHERSQKTGHEKGQGRNQEESQDTYQETGQEKVQGKIQEKDQDIDQLAGYTKGQKAGQEKVQAKNEEQEQEQDQDQDQDQSGKTSQVGKQKGQNMTRKDEKTLIAAFVFLQGCQIYEKENDFLTERIKATLSNEDIPKLQEIHDDDNLLEKMIEKVIEDVKKHEGDEINKNALEGLEVKSITQALQTHSYLVKAHTKAVNNLGIKYQLGNTYVLLDPIQQQIMSDKNLWQLILGSAGTGKTVLLQLKAWDLLEKKKKKEEEDKVEEGVEEKEVCKVPKCEVLIILPQEGVVDVYKSYFGSAHKDRLCIKTFREDWKKIAEVHSPHILIDEFSAIQVSQLIITKRCIMRENEVNSP